MSAQPTTRRSALSVPSSPMVRSIEIEWGISRRALGERQVPPPFDLSGDRRRWIAGEDFAVGFLELYELLRPRRSPLTLCTELREGFAFAGR